jgi:hypothetical protein
MIARMPSQQQRIRARLSRPLVVSAAAGFALALILLAGGAAGSAIYVAGLSLVVLVLALFRTRHSAGQTAPHVEPTGDPASGPSRAELDHAVDMLPRYILYAGLTTMFGVVSSVLALNDVVQLSHQKKFYVVMFSVCAFIVTFTLTYAWLQGRKKQQRWDRT